MKSIIIIILALLSLKIQAQVNLSFDKRFVECEDKWVAFKMNDDSTYSYGFIYIDAQAGLTYNSEGHFKPKEDGTFEVKKFTDSNIKIRLEPNNVKVAIIPQNMFKDLQIEAIPDWLKHYKTDINTAKRQYKLGYMYNGWNECAKALTYLTKAYEIDPNFKGLIVELSFTYNCLKQYNKAVEILEKEIEKSPKDNYINKEYIYSLVKIENIEKASTQFYSSVKLLKDDSFNAENAFQIMQYYYIQKDKKNFKIWYDELKKWPNENEQIKEFAELMKKELK